MKRWSLLVGLATLGLATAVAHADGFLPANSYAYLHPPPALAANNVAPVSNRRVLPRSVLVSPNWGTFTTDAQAGITGKGGTIALKPATQAILITIRPIDTPAGLPEQVAADGNAYRITATEQPGGQPAVLHKAVNVVFRYPHIPVALYLYRDGRWRNLCFADNAYLTPTTIECPTTTFGTFIAVVNPSTVPPSSPSTPLASLNPYIPVIAAALLLIAAAVIGYFVTRPEKRSANGKRRGRRGK